MQESIETNAARLRELQRRINETFRAHPHGPDHDAACNEFHDQYDALAFPGGLAAGLQQLKASDGPTVERAVQLLEADPQFFRSGYIKEKVLRRLKHCDLTQRQQSRIAKLMVRSIDRGGRREFQGYSRLARTIHPAFLLEVVNSRLTSSNPEVARRAQAVLHVLDSNHLPH